VAGVSILLGVQSFEIHHFNYQLYKITQSRSEKNITERSSYVRLRFRTCTYEQVNRFKSFTWGNVSALCSRPNPSYANFAFSCEHRTGVILANSDEIRMSLYHRCTVASTARILY